MDHSIQLIEPTQRTETVSRSLRLALDTIKFTGYNSLS